MTIGDKLIYHGPASGPVIYGENVCVLRLIPHGTYTHDGVILDPQPIEFDSTLGRYIGEWCEVESMDDDIVFRMPQSYFHKHTTNHCGACRAKGPVRD